MYRSLRDRVITDMTEDEFIRVVRSEFPRIHDLMMHLPYAASAWEARMKWLFERTFCPDTFQLKLHSKGTLRTTIVNHMRQNRHMEPAWIL